MTVSLFEHSPKPLTLNVVRSEGRSSFYFVLPTHLKLKVVYKVMRSCDELCRKHGFDFRGAVDGDMQSDGKTSPQFVANAVSRRRVEAKLQSFLTEILRQSIAVPVVTIVRQ
jgi:hypothetical protein